MNIIQAVIWILTLSCGESSPTTIVVDPIENIRTVEKSANVDKYTCHFTQRVNCLWKRNDTTIKMGNEKSCICVYEEIATLQKLECSGIIENPGRKFVTSISSQSVQLNCIYESITNCTWTLNHTIMKIDGKFYKYTHQHDGINVKDCSLEIVSIQVKDGGEWKCAFHSPTQQPCVHSVYNVTVKDISINHPPIFSLITTPTTISSIKGISTEVNSATSNSESDFNMSTGVIIGILMLCVVLVAANSAIVVCVLKYFKKQQSHNQAQHQNINFTPNAASSSSLRTPSLISDVSESFRSIDATAVIDQRRSGSVDEQGYMVPLQVNAQNQNRKAKLKRNPLEVQSRSSENHFYETIDE